jgi:hypothetical protein
MAKKSLGQLLHNAEILQQAAKLTKQFDELNDTILQILRDYLNEVEVRFAPNRPHDWDDHLAVLEVLYGGFILKIPIPELTALDKGLSKKVRVVKMTEKLYFPKLEATETRRRGARLMTCIKRDAKSLSVESQIPEALDVLTEATRPHPLAVRGVQHFVGNVLTPYVFGWAVVPPWDMGTDSREELASALEAVLDGELALPEGNSLITDYDRSYYVGEIEKRAKRREFDAQQVELATHNWNGYSSCEVERLRSRQEVIEMANTESVDQREPHLGTVVSFDDGERILIHVEHGHEFHGWRISHQYIYFDPNARVENVFDEDTYENYEVHTLSMTNGELLPQTRWGLGAP